jgi:mRNA-degrading endonuclease RelE of RelBE toxin-antitoxin system
MRYQVFTLDGFDKSLDKLNKDYQNQIDRILQQLKNNPYVGDQLRYPFLREKRIKEKRVYWLVYDDLKTVLAVAISGKRAQKGTINGIVELLPDYKRYMKKLLGLG